MITGVFLYPIMTTGVILYPIMITGVFLYPIMITGVFLYPIIITGVFLYPLMITFLLQQLHLQTFGRAFRELHSTTIRIEEKIISNRIADSVL